LLDQKKLPTIEEWLPCDTIEQMYTYIFELSVRGAPLIACAAVLSLAIYSVNNPANTDFVQKTEYLRSSRPTAVNLSHACDKILQFSLPQEKRDFSPENISKIAYDIIDRDIEMCDKMGEFGASLIQNGENILHHCNTGSLATMGIGTALGVIRKAHKQGKNIHVYVDETRPLLQGGRLTTYELEKEGIPYTLICDNMAASLMRAGKIQRVVLGADRIARNGDFANKIGTYNVAISAKYHNIPFHCVSPLSTLDPDCPTGADIEIENRNPKEVRGAFGVEWTPVNAKVYNPAFDVTPAELVTSYILDTGIFTNQELDKVFEGFNHK
jgi:methylthioribose-1-phosphate isomerase